MRRHTKAAPEHPLFDFCLNLCKLNTHTYKQTNETTNPTYFGKGDIDNDNVPICFVVVMLFDEPS